jgi:predicted O-linked N-acetylglucosamine transferase (SPINDLY family)
LSAIGLSELVTENAADYENLAVKLASDPQLLSSIRRKLAEGRRTMPLFDTAQLTRQLESAYERMLARWAGGEPPEAFSL